MRSESAEAEKLAALIAPPLAGLGFELVRVTVSGGGRRRLQVMIEKTGGLSVTLDDCTLASRTLSAFLDVADPFPGAYDLEVGSPGIDRPLVRAQDFERFAGSPVRIETMRPIDGRRRFKGKLAGLAEGGRAARVVEDGKAIDLPLDDIQRARLALSEAMAAPRPKGVKKDGKRV